MDKRNLGQNATQSKCLFLHLPFILFNYRHNINLQLVWITVQSLLQISQIVYSSEISENELVALEKEVTHHLESVQEYFNVELIPKHHFMLHYSNTIRAMGPLVHMNMMRFESKHKTFKDFAKVNQNFVNINKSLAIKHQQIMSSNENTYNDFISNGKKIQLEDSLQIKHANLIETITGDDKIWKVKWLQYNNYRYKESLLISCNNFIFEIYKIIAVHQNYYFLCLRFDFKELDKFTNCVKIKKTEPITYEIIKFNELINKRPYEKKMVDNETYVLADTLDLIKLNLL